jgi:hypothetical protein
MNGQAFEFTPGGVQPLVQPTSAPGGTINARDAVEQIRQQGIANPSVTVADVKAGASRQIRKRSLVKEIRARLRDIERELKAMKALEREAVELRRMLAAAKQPPATVADIHAARKSG